MGKWLTTQAHGGATSLLTAPPASARRRGYGADPEEMPGHNERPKASGEDAHERIRPRLRKTPLVRSAHPGPSQRYLLPAPTTLATPNVGHPGDPQRVLAVGRPNERPFDPGDSGDRKSTRLNSSH